MSPEQQKIVPNIWFNRNAVEAGDFYARVFQNTTSEVEARYPLEGLPDFQRSCAGEPLTVALSVSGYRFVLINAGDEFSPNSSISFMLNFDPLLFDGVEATARASLDRLWAELSVGGKVLIPLGEYPFSRRYGWVEDRFGVSWQLILTHPAGDPRPFVIPAFLFGAEAQDRAEDAVDHYVEVFEDAELGRRQFFTEPHGPAKMGAVQFSDFRIGEQWFVAMDAAAAQRDGFTCGVSLEVRCDGQEEIDRLWSALSAVPEAEQCGWLADDFGVSWQIVPDNIAALLELPGAYARMMQMKKLVIADFSPGGSPREH